MDIPAFKHHVLHTVIAVVLAVPASLVMAQTAMERDANRSEAIYQRAAPAPTHTKGSRSAAMTSTDNDSVGASSLAQADTGGPMQDIAEQLQQSSNAAEKMATDPKLKALMKKAKGIFFIPSHHQGILVANNNGAWSNPAFYNVGDVSFGAQAGVEMDDIALLLMSDKAISSFKQDSKFSLHARAGLSIVHYTAKAQEKVGRDDIVVWSDTQDAFSDLTLGVTDINFESEKNRAFYGKDVTAAKLIKASGTNVRELLQVLPGK